MLRSAWIIAANDLRRQVRDRSVIIQALIAPILIAVVVGAAFGGGPDINVTIGVADDDGSSLSEQIATGLVGGGGGGVAFSRVVDAETADAAVQSEAYSAVIVLPDGLQDAVMSGKAASITVLGSPARPLAQGIAESVADGVAARLQTARVTAVAATAAGLEVGPLIAQAAQAPAAVVASQGGVEGTFSIMAYFAPGMAMLFLFFIVGNGARSIIAERREGTLGRILAGPVSAGAVLLGKTLGVMCVGLLSLTTVWLVTWGGFGVSWGDPVGVFLVIVAVVTAIAGVSLLITGLARTENQADAVTTIVALLFAVAGGTFFYGADALSALRMLTPNGQALNAFIELSAGKGAPSDVLTNIAILMAIGLVCGAVGIVGLSKKVRA